MQDRLTKYSTDTDKGEPCRRRHDNKLTYKLAVAALTASQLLPQAEGATTTLTEAIDYEAWLPVVYEQRVGVWTAMVPLNWILVSLGCMIVTTVLITIRFIWQCRQSKEAKREVFVAQPYPTHEPVVTNVRRRVQQRTISTQSPCTYTWHRTTPRFFPLTERQHGAWMDNAKEWIIA